MHGHLLMKKTSIINRFSIPLPTILLLVIFLVLPEPAISRSISLVYDDSGSMRTDNRWSYANYAVQALAALLHKDDHLVVERMNNGMALIKPAGLAPRLDDIRAWGKPENNAGTPYQAVHTAMLRLASSEVVQKGTTNWLIIITDGDFHHKQCNAPGNCSNKEKDRVIEDIKNEIQYFIKNTNAKVRVAFLLIGDNADKEIANIWKKEKPEQVNIFSVSNAKNLLEEMRKIAALITGRDDARINVQSNKQIIQFNSVFPLRRITVFQQGTTAPGNIENVQIPNGIFNPEKVTHSILGHDRLAGKITHIGGQRVMPVGEYIIEFDRQIKKAETQILLEAAVNFSVSITDLSNNKLTASFANQGYNLCDDKQVKIKLRFYQAGTSVPLVLDKNLLKKLTVKGSSNQQTIAFNFNANNAYFQSEAISIITGEQTLSVEARYPGYFHLKSNVFKVIGKECIQNMTVTMSHKSIDVPYLFATKPQPVDGETTLSITSTEKLGNVMPLIITADGIPDGITLQIADQTLTQKNKKVTLNNYKMGNNFTVKILRNKDYRESQAKDIKLAITTENPQVRWLQNEAVLTLQPKPRDLSIEFELTDWKAKVNKLNEATPLGIQLLANGKPINVAELQLWDLALVAGQNHRLKLTFKQNQNNIKYPFQLAVSPYFGSPCFTATGNIPITIEAKGPFPSKQNTAQINLNIISIPWWKKCTPLIFKILSLLVFLWWLFGILNKKRFASSGIVTYQSFSTASRGVTKATQKQTFYLAQNNFVSFVSRWVIPYKPETKLIEGIKFRAGGSAVHIIIPKNYQEKGMTLGGISLEDPGKKDTLLNTSVVLEISRSTRKQSYEYNRNL